MGEVEAKSRYPPSSLRGRGSSPPCEGSGHRNLVPGSGSWCFALRQTERLTSNLLAVGLVRRAAAGLSPTYGLYVSMEG